MWPRVRLTTIRRVEDQRPVRPAAVVMLHVLAEHPAEVRLVEDDQVVEALAANRANHPLSDAFAFGARTGVRTMRMPSRLVRAAQSLS